MMALKLKSGETILFTGDSITDCGRRANEMPLGCGYVRMFSDMLAVREPEKRITIINKGIGGNKITQLVDRWDDDMMRHRPDWLSIKIGINDLHRHLAQAEDGVSPKLFEECYDQIITRTRKQLPTCKILLISPFYISTCADSSCHRKVVLDLLPSYIRVVRAMSRKYHTRLVDTHSAYQKLLRYHEPDLFCNEPVHPNDRAGHMVIAEEVWKALSK